MSVIRSIVSACFLLAGSAGAVVPATFTTDLEQPEHARPERDHSGPRRGEGERGREHRDGEHRGDQRSRMAQGLREERAHGVRPPQRERLERLRDRVRSEGGPRNFARHRGIEGRGEMIERVRERREMLRGPGEGRGEGRGDRRGHTFGRGERGHGDVQGQHRRSRGEGMRGEGRPSGRGSGDAMKHNQRPNMDRPQGPRSRPEGREGRPVRGNEAAGATDAREQRILAIVERLNERLDRLERHAPGGEREDGRRLSGPAEGPGRPGRDDRGEGRGPAPRPERGQNGSERNRE